jgi:peptide/nickel transport system substrate-binding protein
VETPAGMSALVFNTRRPIFADPRVREALIKLFDFEWVNRTLYHGQFARSESYFARSGLSSHGRPADARERNLLAPYADEVKPEIMNGSFAFPVSDGTGENREGISSRTASSSRWRRASLSSSKFSPPPAPRKGCSSPMPRP